MKNKNKKKKKKSKKDKKDGENEEASGKEESVEPADQLKEEVSAEEPVENKEDTTENDDKAEEPKIEEKEEPLKEPKETENIVKEGTQINEAEDTTESKVESAPDKEEKLAEKLEALAVDEQDIKEKTAGAGQVSEDPVDDLFPDSGPSFMDSIKQSQADEALLKVQQENQSLKEEVAKLKADNKSLKILKLDHLDQIETLESKVADLESKLAKAKVDSSHNTVPGSAYDQDDNLSLSPTPSFQQQSFPTSFSQFNSLHKNESQLSITEIKARLNKWKNWNIDMTNWRSVGSGPIVEL